MPLWKQDLLTLTVQTVVKGVHIAQCSILCLVEYFFIFVLSIVLLVLGFTACDYRFGIFTLFLTFDSRETILNICFSETTELLEHKLYLMICWWTSAKYMFLMFIQNQSWTIITWVFTKLKYCLNLLLTPIIHQSTTNMIAINCIISFHTMFGSSLLQLFVGGLMSYLRYLYLLAHSGVHHILCCVFLFCLSSSCVPCVASFSGFPIFDCHFGVL